MPLIEDMFAELKDQLDDITAEQQRTNARLDAVVAALGKHAMLLESIQQVQTDARMQSVDQHTALVRIVNTVGEAAGLTLNAVQEHCQHTAQIASTLTAIAGRAAAKSNGRHQGAANDWQPPRAS